MKRILFLSLLFCLPLLGFGQKQTKKVVKETHIAFMGVKLGVPIEDFKKALHEKGFSYGKESFNMEGEFWEIRNALIGIGTTGGIVDYVSVKLEEHQYVPLVQAMQKKYGMPKVFEDKIEHQYYWDVSGGRIVIRDFVGSLYHIYYWDFPKVSREESKRKAKKDKSEDL